MKMSNEQYGKYVKRKSPSSTLWPDILHAFLIGGAICCVGQGIHAIWAGAGLGEEDAATATSIVLIFIGALLTGLGLYDDLARFAGGGSLIPITGFANAVAAPALEFKSEGLVLGTAVKLFSIAGPVIVYGVSASVIYGLVLCLLPLIS